MIRRVRSMITDLHGVLFDSWGRVERPCDSVSHTMQPAALFSNARLLFARWDRCLDFDCSSYCTVDRQVGFSQVVI